MISLSLLAKSSTTPSPYCSNHKSPTIKTQKCETVPPKNSILRREYQVYRPWHLKRNCQGKPVDAWNLQRSTETGITELSTNFIDYWIYWLTNKRTRRTVHCKSPLKSEDDNSTVSGVKKGMMLVKDRENDSLSTHCRWKWDFQTHLW